MAERKYFDYDENELTPSQAAKKRYKQKHREKVLEDARVYAKKRYAENTEREKARHKKWREDNPEKYKESCKKSSAKKYKDNPEKVKERVKQWAKDNPDKVNEYSKQYKKRNPEKVAAQKRKDVAIARKRYPEKARARLLLAEAVRIGHLTRPTTCSLCQSEKRIEGHHPDYDKPLEVVWLCRKCHLAEHKRLK